MDLFNIWWVKTEINESLVEDQIIRSGLTLIEAHEFIDFHYPGEEDHSDLWNNVAMPAGVTPQPFQRVSTWE